MHLLVLGAANERTLVAAALEGIGASVTDCDPTLGDCVMYVQLEQSRYDGFVFVGQHDPVTRGAAAVVPERSIVIPLFDTGPDLDPAHDAYLFRLPRALGFRNENDRAALLSALPDASNVPSEILGPGLSDQSAWRRLLDHLTQGTWQWQSFVTKVEQQVEHQR